MTLAIHSIATHKSSAPVFREKDAVCIEARASKITAAVSSAQPRAFQYQQGDMQIMAQLSRHQSVTPVASSQDVALAYQQTRLSMRASMHEMRV